MTPLSERPNPALFFLLVLFAISGCSSLSFIQSKPQADQLIGSQSQLLKKYQADQNQRRLQLKNWQINGVLDIDHEEHGRRNRIVITTHNGDQLRLRIYGPFKQVAFDLLVDQQWLQLTKPKEHQVIRVPSSVDGMNYLTGFLINPNNLSQFFTATAPQLATGPKETSIGVEATTITGEKVQLDPVNGYIKQRWSANNANNKYSLQYHWPKTANNSQPPALPSKIAITIPKESMVVTFILRKWRVDNTESQKAARAIPAGFSIVEPFTQQR
ncbi:MAG: hypothetical protein HQL70_00605 [Magnetococcales bacterium]|nr:hypothetical protein [Magnetococcales bacterium]